MEVSSSKSLPENAYRPLKPGETYEPIVPAGSAMPEFTPRSVTLGIVMAAVFSAAAAFLGLKVGQVFEAAIPIAILAGWPASFRGLALQPVRREDGQTRRHRFYSDQFHLF